MLDFLDYQASCIPTVIHFRFKFSQLDQLFHLMIVIDLTVFFIFIEEVLAVEVSQVAWMAGRMLSANIKEIILRKEWVLGKATA